MKVLHVTRELGSEVRFGLGQSVGQLIQGQRHLGVEVHKLTADALDEEQFAALSSLSRSLGRWTGMVGHPIWTIFARAWTVGQVAAIRAESEGFTHVHCHDAVIAMGLRHKLQGRAVHWGVTLHGFDSIADGLNRYVTKLPRRVMWAMKWLERRTLQSADWVIALTGRGRHHVASSLNVSTGERWHIVPHGRPQWTLPERAGARAQLGWDASARYLLAVGQLVPLKRFDWVMRALATCPPDWQLVILGEGDRTSAMRLACSLGLRAPIIESTDYPALQYAAADCYVSASATESFGMANLEALHAGLPALCTAVGGVPEVVGDGAIQVPDSFGAFGSQLANFLADDGLRAELQVRAKHHMLAWPSVQQIAERHLTIYGNVVKVRPAS